MCSVWSDAQQQRSQHGSYSGNRARDEDTKDTEGTFANSGSEQEEEEERGVGGRGGG